MIAFGTPTIRQNALNILLHYWPIPIPEFLQDSHSIFAGIDTCTCIHTHTHTHTAVSYYVLITTITYIYNAEWSTPNCENTSCRKGNSRVTTVRPSFPLRCKTGLHRASWLPETERERERKRKRERGGKSLGSPCHTLNKSLHPMCCHIHGLYKMLMKRKKLEI